MRKTPKIFSKWKSEVKMEFLALEKMVKTAPTEQAELESTSTMGFKEKPEKSKKTQIRVKSYDQFFR